MPQVDVIIIGCCEIWLAACLPIRSVLRYRTNDIVEMRDEIPSDSRFLQSKVDESDGTAERSAIGQEHRSCAATQVAFDLKCEKAADTIFHDKSDRLYFLSSTWIFI